MLTKKTDGASLQVCVKWVEPLVFVLVGLNAADPRAIFWEVFGALCVILVKVEPA